MRNKRVCIVPRLSVGSGGPNSFYRNIIKGLTSRDLRTAQGFRDEPYDTVLVINGTRELGKLYRSKRLGKRIVQRLGNINLLHYYLPIGARGYLLSLLRNLIMYYIRSFIADHIIYQSNFVENVWNSRYGHTKADTTIIYNGVDLKKFTPEGPSYKPKADVCIISVEGNQGTDPFDIAVELAEGLIERGIRTELLMFGNPWKKSGSRLRQHQFVHFMGSVPNNKLPFFYRGASFYISTDIITAACPNSVLEALACGTPVLGYRTGVLPELLNESAGICVESYGDPWKGEPPRNLDEVVNAALKLIAHRDQYRKDARSLAEKRYGLDKMVDAYVETLGL